METTRRRFDSLRELDLLSGGQELVPAGLAQEELQRIRRRLHRRGERDNRLGMQRLLDDLDAALVELPQERVLLELGQLERLADLREVGGPNRAGLLGLLEQLPDLLGAENVFDDVDLGHARRGTR
jgi:hypothetical protein